METHSLEPILTEHPFFKDLDENLLKLIVGCSSNVTFGADDYVFHEGDTADKFYVIREGNVAVEIPTHNKDSVRIQTLVEGDILGWSWLMPPYLWHFDARVLEATRAIALDAVCLRKKMEEDHEIGYQLLKRFVPIMTERLQSTRLQLLDFYRSGN